MSAATRAWLIGLLGWTILLSCYHLDGGAGFEPTDCWVAQTAREMYEAGEWLVPRFSGEARMQKSPGPYWAVMITARLRGTGVDEVAARFPNAMAAVVLVATIFWLTRRIAGDRAAVFAGFTAASSTLILYWSHRGASDLGLAACTTLSLTALWIATEVEPPGWKRNALFLLGYFAAGVGMLYKMPMPLAVVGLPALVYVVLRLRFRVFLHWVHIAGLLLFLLPWLPWAVAVVMHEPAAIDKWRVEYLDRYTGDLPNVVGQNAWPFYFLYLIPTVVFTLPYTLSLPAALARPFRREEGVHRGGMFFLLIWFVSLFAFFTASVGKESRYFLPALPPLLCLLGVELSRFFDSRREMAPSLVRLGVLATCTLVPAGVAGGVYGIKLWFEKRGRFEPSLAAPGELLALSEVLMPYIVTGGLFTIGAIAAAVLYARGTRNASFGAMVAMMWLVWLWAWPRLFPVLVSQAPYKDFAAQLVEHIPPEKQGSLRQIAQQDPRITWYSNYRFPRIIDQLDLLEEQGGVRNLQYERRRIGEEIIQALSAEDQVLLVAELRALLEFMILAPPELERERREMPPIYVWLKSRYGAPDLQCVLFSSKPPPPPLSPIAIDIPEGFRRKVLEAARLPAETRAPPPAASQSVGSG